MDDVEPCPACGALPGDWANNPFATLAPAAPVEDLRAIANEAQFLIDRIRSWADWSLDAETLANEWNGHVDPPLSRLSKLLATLDKPQGVGDNGG